MEAVIPSIQLVLSLLLSPHGDCTTCTPDQLLTNVQHGKMFPGYQLLNLSSDGILQCSTFCLRRSRCRSFNFNTATGECQLNTDSPTGMSPLIADSEFIFSDISSWPARLAGVCEGHTCPLDSVCEPVDAASYTCVTLCHGAPEIQHGLVLHPGPVTQVGAKLNATCNNGYLLEAEVVCQSTGTWSRGVCVALTSCSKVKDQQPAAGDGEYWLLVLGETYPARVYCHNMSSQDPTEYLSLKNLNVGVFPKVANLNCVGETDLLGSCVGKGGEVSFSKIRLNVSDSSSIKVILDDVTFATTSYEANEIYYGQATDCYTPHYDGVLAACGLKGSFTIDLRGTGWRVGEGQTWEAFGWNAFMFPPQRELNGTVVHLQCGGYFGGCSPVGGLSLTPYPLDATLLA